MRIVECEQYDGVWTETRRGKVTCSSLDRIVTPAKGDYSKQSEAYACELVADLFDPHYGLREDYVSAAMKNGTIMEPEARRWYEFEANADVRQVGFCIADDERLGCSPDGLVGDEGGLELKSPNRGTHIKYLYDGVLPQCYKPQVHGCLIVTGRKWWDFMSYVAGLPPLLVRVEPDDYTERVRETLAEFFADFERIKANIAAKHPPPPPPKIVTAPGFVPTEVPAFVSPF